MSSPTYNNCTTGGVIPIDTPNSYCSVKGGHPYMDVCCAQYNNGDAQVNFAEPCFSWCPLDPNDFANTTVSNVQRTTLFLDCLRENSGEIGSNATFIQANCRFVNATGASEEVSSNSTNGTVDTGAALPASSQRLSVAGVVTLAFALTLALQL